MARHVILNARYFKLISFLTVFALFIPLMLFAQSDSVDVTFYFKTSSSASVVYIAGEFNNWANNIGGVISDMHFAMAHNPISDEWIKTERLRNGGVNPLPNQDAVPGAYQYKFNENGGVSGWTQDPLNPRQNPRDNNNSYLMVQDPTLYHLLPNSVSGLVTTSSPEVSAFIFPGISSTVDTSMLELTIDDTMHFQGIGSYYEDVYHRFTYTLPVPLLNGTHKMVLTAACTGEEAISDSAFFNVQAGFIQFLTRSNDHHIRSTHWIRGLVQDTSVTMVRVVHNGDSTDLDVSDGLFGQQFGLEEGENLFEAFVYDSAHALQIASPIAIHYIADHVPRPVIITFPADEKVQMRVEGNDPDSDPLTYTWLPDSLKNPENMSFTEAGTVITINKPAIPGAYYMDLTAVDPDSNQGYARAVFWIDDEGSAVAGTINTSPSWLDEAIVYEIYLPAFTSSGTFAAAREKLEWIRALGANVIWLMPIYDNGELINELNAGYNVTDLYSVHPQLGTMADFDAFLEEAHDLGIRIILDSTPNHVSENHPWVYDIKLYQDYSNYRPVIETRILGDDRGLGQVVHYDQGYKVYTGYSNWSLANLNYSSEETVQAMMEMYTWWLCDKGVDGYRMDVYWGPQNRYGESVWWRPLREELKRIKPELFILGETDGTGYGSEINYADGGGGADAAYDWSLYGQIKNALSGGSLGELDNRVHNYSPNLYYNHHTGPNAHYFRFLENHDESRIASLYPGDRGRAGAVMLMTVPGIPMIYAGQEVGETSRRGLINWNRASADEYLNHYQRLTAIRKTFPAFSSNLIKTLYKGPARVFAYLRPREDQNGIVAINFSSSSCQINLNINDSDLFVSTDSLTTGKTYYLNDVMNNAVYQVCKTDLDDYTISLDPWQAAVFVLADSAITLETKIDQQSKKLPAQFELLPNYPNPFNGLTTIPFTLAGQKAVHTEAAVYNMLGERIRLLASGMRMPGRHALMWNGKDNAGIDVATGLYIVRIVSGNQVRQRKMLLLK